MSDSDNSLSHDVIGLAMRIHTQLGPGLFESVYETVLAGKLVEAGHHVERQRSIDITFEGMRFSNAFKIDLLIDRHLVIEVKAVEQVNALHARQLLTYLRLMNLPLGLVINFNVLRLTDGLKRVINTMSTPSVHSAHSA